MVGAGIVFFIGAGLVAVCIIANFIYPLVSWGSYIVSIIFGVIGILLCYNSDAPRWFYILGIIALIVGFLGECLVPAISFLANLLPILTLIFYIMIGYNCCHFVG